MIVEDNVSFRQDLIRLLSSRFPLMKFEQAGDGKEAIKKITYSHPDLVFMDIKLPGETGLELTSKIKKSYSDTIIIILTYYDFPEYRHAAKQSGANYFISKGSSSGDEILALVESILSEINRSIEKGYTD